jgi:hypothetical protein
MCVCLSMCMGAVTDTHMYIIYTQHTSTYGDGVGEAERAAPRPPEDRPALDAQVRPKALDVGDQVPRPIYLFVYVFLVVYLG